MDKINSILHTYSSKPLLYGTRDAIIVATLTVLVLLVIYAIYYGVTGNITYMGTLDFWKGMGRSFATGMILGYVYEYGGINARFSAEAMRFAKGSTLDKYQTRNEALVAEIAAESYRAEVEREVRANPACNIKLDEVSANVDKINAMVRSTREQKVIARMFSSPTDEIMRELTAKYQTKLTSREVELLKNLDSDAENNLSRLNAVSRLVELFGTNIDLVRYFVRNGFSKLRAIKSKNGWTIDVKDLSEKTSVKINGVGIGSSVNSLSRNEKDSSVEKSALSVDTAQQSAPTEPSAPPMDVVDKPLITP